MPIPKTGAIRVASFNAENLFSRISIFKSKSSTPADLLARVAELQGLMDAPVYDKPAMMDLFFGQGLEKHIDFRVDRKASEKAGPWLMRRNKTSQEPEFNRYIKGRADWAGEIIFVRTKLSSNAVNNIRRVIEEMDADILCLCEVEDRRVLQQFCDQVLVKRWPYNMLIDGNDTRGIDVGIISKLPMRNLRSNIATREGNGSDKPLFGRDCIEVEIVLPNGKTVSILGNHFKSKSGDEVGTDLARIAQSTEVSRILKERYQDATGKWLRSAIVAGDLNEQHDRNGANNANLGTAKTSIDALLTFSGLHNVLQTFAGEEPAWTYIFDGRRQQIDYLLVSDDLARKGKAAGIVTLGRSDDPANGITDPLDAASDHNGIWFDFDLP